MDLNNLVKKGVFDELVVVCLEESLESQLEQAEKLVAVYQEYKTLKKGQFQDLVDTIHTGKALLEVLRYYSTNRYDTESLRLNKAHDVLMSVF